MANSQILVELKLAAENFKRGAAEAKGSFDQLSTGAEQARQGFQALAVAQAAFVTANTAIAATSVRTFAEFEQGIANVASVANASTDELDALTAAAERIGNTTRLSAT